MRTLRLLFAAAAVVALSLLALPHPASAQDGEGTAEGATTEVAPEGTYEELVHELEEAAKENGGTEFDEHCIELLAEGNSIDDCQAAPSPILPEINEIIWGAVGFFIVFGFIAWKGYPAMKKGMNARTERIQGDLDAAEAQRTEAGTVLSEYQAQLADARNESARIIEEARQAADEVKATLVAKAEADVAEMRSRASSEIDAAKAQATADLRNEVAALAIGAAEQVVERNLDRDTNVALVEAYIDQVGAST